MRESGVYGGESGLEKKKTAWGALRESAGCLWRILSRCQEASRCQIVVVHFSIEHIGIGEARQWAPCGCRGKKARSGNCVTFFTLAAD